MDPLWAALLGALVGALVGGAASTLGALIVSKRSQTRTYRARIYDEQLPRIVGLIDRNSFRLGPGQEITSAVSAIVTAGHVIGGDDDVRVDQLQDRLEVWSQLARQSTSSDGSGGLDLVFRTPEAEAQYRASRSNFVATAEAYRTWLRGRLSNRI